MPRQARNKPDSRAYDVLTERAQTFEIEDKDGEKQTLVLYPLQLGRLALISRRLLDLDMVFDIDNDEADAVQRMWKICSDKPQQVAEIVAIATLKTKEDIDAHLEERTNALLWSPTMTPQAYTNLLYTIALQSYHADFMKAIRSVRMLRVNVSQQTEAERIAPTAGEAFGEH